MFSERMGFAITKALAVRAIRELRTSDPENLYVQAKEKALLKVATVNELNEAVDDGGHPEEFWVEAFIRERSEELVSEIFAAAVQPQ